MFRDLKAYEIEVRASTVKENGCSLLLYKDSRVDMNLLDETYGAFGWKREHTRDNRNCIVSIWDKDKAQWVPKEDTGTSSYAEAEKGLASDSFKRACFNWGIGRELYTSPFIWVNLNKGEASEYKGKWRLGFNTKFVVKAVTIVNKSITGLIIVDQKGVVRYKLGDIVQPVEETKKTPEPETTPHEKFEDHSTITEGQKKSLADMLKYYTETKNTKGLEFVATIKTREAAAKAIESFSIKMAQKVFSEEYEQDEIASGQQAQQMDIF